MRFFREKELWVLALLPVLLFFRPLFLGETFFYRDLYLHFLPQKQLMADLIRSWQWPLWNPYMHGGQPLLADPNSLVLYPSSLLYLFLSATTALSFDLVAHTILAGIGMYLLARVLQLKPGPALVAGIVYGFCGYSLSLLNMLNRIIALPYLPLMLLCWHLFLADNKRKWFAFAVCCSVLQMLAGAPEFTILTWLTLFGWSFFHSAKPPIRKVFLWWTILILLTVAIAGIQIVPTVEMYQQSWKLPASGEITWSLNPKRLPELLVDHFLGATDTLAASDYWGSSIEDKSFPYILSIYWGGVVFLFAAAGLVAQDSPLSRRVRLFLMLFAFGSLILSFGRYLPFFEAIHRSHFLFSLFRFPIKVLAGALAPVALLAGIGTESIFETSTPRKTLLLAAVVMSVIGFIYLVLIRFSDAFALSFVQFFFDSAQPAIRESLASNFFRGWLFWPAATLLLVLHARKPGSRQALFVAAIVATDLITASRGLNPTAPAGALLQLPEAALIAEQEIGNGRFYRAPNPGISSLRAPSNDIIWQYRWHLQTLNYYLGAYYKIPVIFHEDYVRLAPERIMKLKLAVESAPWAEKKRILSASNVSLVGSFDEIAELEKIAAVKNFSPLPFYLYRNRDAAPRVVFHADDVFVNTFREALLAIRSPGFDASHSAVIEGGGTKAPKCADDASQSTTLMRNAMYSSYRVETRCAGYLVFAETYYPGWEVELNHKPVRIYPANAAFSAIYLEPGSHLIERMYRPKSIVAGFALSVLGTITLALLVLLRRRPKASSSPHTFTAGS